jgi:hypothetical protein
VQLLAFRNDVLSIQRDPDSHDSDDAPLDVPQLSGEGKEHVTIVHGRKVKLHGTATATYSQSWHIDNQVVTRATGCKGCKPPAICVHTTGSLVSDYSVSTNVKLPPIPKGLTECEEAKAQDFIDGPLADHEQQHVDAFAQYDGTTSTPIDLKRCGTDAVTAAAAAMHDKEESKRRAAADKASRKLDPWNKVADLTCDE